MATKAQRHEERIMNLSFVSSCLGGNYFPDKSGFSLRYNRLARLPLAAFSGLGV